MNQITDNSEMGLDAPAIPAKPYRMHARIAWILMAIVAVIALIPVLGFASWFIAGPMLLVSFVMIILVFANGGVAHGLALLACQIVVMPLIVIFGPFISSALGFAGVASSVGASGGQPASPPYVAVPAPQTLPASPPSESAMPLAESPVTATTVLPEDLRVLKSLLQDQQPAVTAWLSKGLAAETTTGYLKAGDAADVDSRRAIQQQNVWRENAFERIANLTGKSPEEVARTYARLASGK
jgi:uncharacterized protein YdbL (DUF1318 family)